MKTKTIHVALLGCGNVGSGTYKVLEDNRDLISRRIGAEVCVSRILVQDKTKERLFPIPGDLFTQEASDIFDDPKIQVVAELMGGIEPAVSYMRQALGKGKHVVSANKAALALHGKELTQLALDRGLMLRYEAAVCGAIPIMNAISTALAANRITGLEGILNGTTNYILTKMDEEGASYEEVLADAQAKGFAEADPTGDVEGHDAVNKLVLLIAAAFGLSLSPDRIRRRGITDLTAADLDQARQEGKKIKLIARAHLDDQGEIQASVEPLALAGDHPLASVRNELNGVFLTCNMAGDIFLQGPGAGPLPTGSAVAGDLMEIAAALVRGSAHTSLPTMKV